MSFLFSSFYSLNNSMSSECRCLLYSLSWSSLCLASSRCRSDSCLCRSSSCYSMVISVSLFWPELASDGICCFSDAMSQIICSSFRSIPCCHFFFGGTLGFLKFSVPCEGEALVVSCELADFDSPSAVSVDMNDSDGDLSSATASRILFMWMGAYFPNEVISRPSTPTIVGRNIETMNKVMVKGRFILSNQSVMVVNLHYIMIIWDEKHKDLSMKLLRSRHSWIKLKDCIDRGTGAASVLPVCNVEFVLSALESYTSQQNLISQKKISPFLVTVLTWCNLVICRRELFTNGVQHGWCTVQLRIIQYKYNSTISEQSLGTASCIVLIWHWEQTTIQCRPLPLKLNIDSYDIWFWRFGTAFNLTWWNHSWRISPCYYVTNTPCLATIMLSHEEALFTAYQIDQSSNASPLLLRLLLPRTNPSDLTGQSRSPLRYQRKKEVYYGLWKSERPSRLLK